MQWWVSQPELRQSKVRVKTFVDIRSPFSSDLYFSVQMTRTQQKSKKVLKTPHFRFHQRKSIFFVLSSSPKKIVVVKTKKKNWKKSKKSILNEIKMKILTSTRDYVSHGCVRGTWTLSRFSHSSISVESKCPSKADNTIKKAFNGFNCSIFLLMFFCCQVKVVVWRVGWNKINISASAVKSTFHSVLHLPFELQRKPKKDKQKYVYDHLNFLYFKKNYSWT